jgi:hypothetical protein
MYDWIIGGAAYPLDDGTYCYLNSVEGMGMPNVRRIEESGPLQNGITDRGYRIDPRLIVVSLDLVGSSITDLYDKRRLILDIFKPKNTPGKLRFISGNTRREIEAFYVGDSLRIVDTSDTYLAKRVSVALRCPDPRWYDPVINSVNFNISGGADTFVIPFEVPFKLGASTIDTTKPIVYSGNVKSYPTIRIEGPITDPVITNMETGHKLDFTGITIPAGTTYIIDLGYADNTIVTDTGVNKISELTTDSDLVEFCIDPDYGGGTNNIRVTGSSVSEATNVRIAYYDYYIGV